MRKVLFGMIYVALWAVSIGVCVGEEPIVQKSVMPAEKFRSAIHRNLRLLDCSDSRDDYAFTECVEGHTYYGNPPVITTLIPRSAAGYALDGLRDQLTWFLCASIWKSFGGITLAETQSYTDSNRHEMILPIPMLRRLRDNCYGEKQLKASLLYFELIPDRVSSVPMVTMKIYGSSTFLATKMQDYWELHRLSFQLIPSEKEEKLIASVFDSRMQKYRGGTAKDILFDQLMAPQYGRDIAELLDRILAILANKEG